MLKKGDKIAIVCCSNGQLNSYKEKIDILLETIRNIGLIPVCSKFIYEKNSVFSGSAKERGTALMEFYKDNDIKAIFDISGGDIANEVLDYMDFDIISNNYKPFFGYSDLTTIVNALYTKTNKPSYLYQIRNLIYDKKEENQIRNFTNSIINDKDDLYDIDYTFIQGKSLEGVVIGGNIRCFLKLAGTSFMPSFENKVLLLEGMSGGVAKMATYLAQLKQIGAFNKVKGIILGTFTEMERDDLKPDIKELVIKIVDNKDIPIAKTMDIGHGTNSKCMIIGKKIKL